MRSSMRSRAQPDAALHVAVIDPNHVNPYGGELARVLGGFAAVDWVTTGPHAVAPAGVREIPILGGERRSRGAASLVRRMWSPVRIASGASRYDAVVIAWPRDAWSSTCLSWIRPTRLYAVYHNPVASRDRDGLAARAQRRLFSRATVCVHSASVQRSAAAVGVADTHVTAHPAYRLGPRPPRNPEHGRVVFLGGLRADKGADQLARIIESIGSPVTLVTVGPDALDADSVRRIEAAGSRYECVGGGGPVAEDELQHELARAQVVLAPYRDVTESGSLLMCLSTGTPVLAFDSPAAQRILTAGSLAVDAEGLGDLVAQFGHRAWDTFRITADQQDTLCQTAWRGLLSAHLSNPKE